MGVTLGRIEEAAPDQASLNAAKKLLRPGKWPGLFVDAAGGLLWGECQGSGATPYRMAVAVRDLGAKCSCPSRKFPCKHALALMWWRAEEPARFVEGEVPDWVSQWLSRRRGGGKAKADDAKKPGAKKSARAAVEAAVGEAPKEPSKSSAAARERNRAAREASIRAGLDELDVWIADQFEQGLGAFSQRATEQCRVASRRLADAKATGLSTRVEALAALYFATPESLRNDVLLQQLGALHLLAEAYRRQQELEPPLRNDVRRLVGWTTTRADLLAAPEAERVSGTWSVLAIVRTTQPDRLVRCETWLAAADAAAPRTHAVLVDYVPASGASSWIAPAARGERIGGELVFHPSAAPLSAILVAGEAGDALETEPAVPGTSADLGAALSAYDAQLAAHPWLGPRPLAALAVARRDAAGGIWFTDDAAEVAVATDPDHEEACAPLVGLGPVALHGVFDGDRVTPLAAATPLGPWWNEAL
ncbi:MAG: SWIM zinc finger family protein [Myxococcota bacterium]|nr:SWIM zinc finger family protein [Myxococcota bacterium]